jgi:hypothetical protein
MKVLVGNAENSFNCFQIKKLELVSEVLDLARWLPLESGISHHFT